MPYREAIDGRRLTFLRISTQQNGRGAVECGAAILRLIHGRYVRATSANCATTARIYQLTPKRNSPILAHSVLRFKPAMLSNTPLSDSKK